MRLHVLSDLHLEFAPFTPLPVEAEAVILAGDIQPGRKGLHWALKTFPDRPVVYVLGNHEFYGHSLQKLTEDLREQARGTHVHVLENESLLLGEVVILGASLWTDFALNGDAEVAKAAAHVGINDYQRIRAGQRYSHLKPVDTSRLHFHTLRWLEGQISELKGKKLVVVTHHAPTGQSIPRRFNGHPLNPALASDLSEFLYRNPVRLWVHGHIHYPCDYVVGNTRVLANPRGYPMEWQNGFDPTLIVEV